MELPKEDWVLLEKWLDDPSFLHWAKGTKEEEIAQWEHFFNANPGYWELGKMGKQLANGFSFQKIPENPAQKKQALGHLLQRLKKEPEKKQLTWLAGFTRKWQAAAAFVLLLLCAGGLYFQFYHNPEIVLNTPYGEKLSTELPDGSRVVLNANSSLRYFSQFPRKVWLDGEAFFEVKKRPETGEPFLVITRDLEVNVLGTTFNVNTRNDQTEVFLEEGSVQLNIDDPDRQAIRMIPGELVAYSSKSSKIEDSRKNVSSSESLSWKEGTLVFKDTPLPEALFDIEDIYGIQFVLQGEGLKKQTISGGVPIEDLQVTLSILSHTHDLAISKKGKRYFIHKDSKSINQEPEG